MTEQEKKQLQEMITYVAKGVTEAERSKDYNKGLRLSDIECAKKIHDFLGFCVVELRCVESHNMARPNSVQLFFLYAEKKVDLSDEKYKSVYRFLFFALAYLATMISRKELFRLDDAEEAYNMYMSNKKLPANGKWTKRMESAFKDMASAKIKSNYINKWHTYKKLTMQCMSIAINEIDVLSGRKSDEENVNHEGFSEGFSEGFGKVKELASIPEAKIDVQRTVVPKDNSIIAEIFTVDGLPYLESFINDLHTIKDSKPAKNKRQELSITEILCRYLLYVRLGHANEFYLYPYCLDVVSFFNYLRNVDEVCNLNVKARSIKDKWSRLYDQR